MDSPPPVDPNGSDLLAAALGAAGPLTWRPMTDGRWLIWSGPQAWELEVESRAPWLGSTLLRRLAAEALLAGKEFPPGPPPPLLFEPSRFGPALLVRPHEATTLGSTRLEQEPQDHPAVAFDLGTLLAVLEELPQPTAALGVGPQGFVPTAARLAEQMVQRGQLALALARRAGIDPGPVAQRLLQELTDLAEADQAPAVLSHGDPTPLALTYRRAQGRYVAARVIGWASAAAAPPSRDRAALLDLQTGTLAALLQAYGRDRAAEWPLDALRAWHLLRALERLGHLGDALLAGDRGSVVLVEHACQLAERALDPSFASRALREALAAAPGPRPLPGLRPDPRRAALRRTLHGATRLGSSPPALVQAWVAALAADLLPLEADWSAPPPGLDGLAQAITSSFLDSLPLPEVEGPPVPDREAFWAALAQAAADDDRSQVFLEVARAAVARLHDQVSDTLLRRVEAAFWSIRTAHVPFASDPPALRLGRAALAAGAASTAERAMLWADLAEAAAEELELPPGLSSAADLGSLLEQPAPELDQALRVALLARALRRVALPVDLASLAQLARW